MKKPISIAEYISDVQKRAKLNGEELAEKVGITPSSITQFKKGKGLPSPETCGKLADIVGDPVEKVFSILQLSKAEKTGDVVYIEAWHKIVKASGFMLGLVIMISIVSPAVAQANMNGCSFEPHGLSIMRQILARLRRRRRKCPIYMGFSFV